MAEREFVYEVIVGLRGGTTHAISARAKPFDVKVHSPLCGAHFKAAPTVSPIASVLCEKCLRRLDEMMTRGKIPIRKREL